MSTNPCAAFFLKAPQPSIAMCSQQQGAGPMSPPPMYMGSPYTVAPGMPISSSTVGNELGNQQMVGMDPGGSLMTMGQDTGQLMMSHSGMMIPMAPSAIPMSNQASLMPNQTPLMTNMVPVQSSLPNTMPSQVTSMNSGITPEQMANSTAPCTNGIRQPDGLQSPPHSATVVTSAVTMGPFTSATSDPASQGSEPTTPTTTSGQGVTETTSESSTTAAEGEDPYKAVAEYEEAIAQYNSIYMV